MDVVANPSQPENRSEVKSGDHQAAEASVLRPEIPAEPPMWRTIASLILLTLFIACTLFFWFTSL
jgi:hypothetical protein